MRLTGTAPGELHWEVRGDVGWRPFLPRPGETAPQPAPVVVAA